MRNNSNIYVIDGSEKRLPQAQSRLNNTLAQITKDALADYGVTDLRVSDGYAIAKERQKFAEAAIIIFHVPIFWFSLPATLKQYIDDVYTGPEFFQAAAHYGTGGKLDGKRYMLVTTWNAPRSAFYDPQSILARLSPDDILKPFHLTNQYVGLRPLPSFSIHDVVKAPDIAEYEQAYRQHLSKYLPNNF